MVKKCQKDHVGEKEQKRWLEILQEPARSLDPRMKGWKWPNKVHM